MHTVENQVRVPGRCCISETRDGAASLHVGREAVEQLVQDDSEAVHVALEVDLERGSKKNSMSQHWHLTSLFEVSGSNRGFHKRSRKLKNRD